eukprot:6395939-Pyramimonas_sp.AAC.1
MPVECRQYWECLRTPRRMQINPAYQPHIDDGSDRYIVVKCDAKDTAVIADNDAHARWVVRNLLRGRPALIRVSGKSYLTGILKEDGVVGPDL